MKKNCPEGKIINPVTNRCVSITSKIGKLLTSSVQKPASPSSTKATQSKATKTENDATDSISLERAYIEGCIKSLKSNKKMVIEYKKDRNIERGLKNLMDIYGDYAKQPFPSQSFVADVDIIVELALMEMMYAQSGTLDYFEKEYVAKNAVFKRIMSVKIGTKTISQLTRSDELLRFIYDSVKSIYHGIWNESGPNYNETTVSQMTIDKLESLLKVMNVKNYDKIREVKSMIDRLKIMFPSK
jgi:hypothetical protein